MSNKSFAPLAKDWRWRKFGDCARFINGRAYSQEELLDSGTPVLRIQNLNGGDRWYYSKLSLPDEKHCDAGDLLYAWSASFGPYRFAGPRSIFHYHIWRVVPNEELDKDFAFRLLEWITARIKAAAHGVAMLHMTKAGMEAWPIPLPRFPEQRRIAEALDKADALRAKRRAALAQLDTLTQSIFLDMFGDPAANPRGWPRTGLHEAYWFQEGPGVRKWQFQDKGVKLLNVGNIEKDGSLDLDKTNRYLAAEEAFGKYRHFLADAGDLVIASSGISFDDDGLLRTRGAFVSEEHLPLCMNTSTIRFKALEGISDLRFLWVWLNSGEFRSQITRLVTGTAQQNFGPSHLSSLTITLPPLALQYEFARRVGAVDTLRMRHRASYAELGTLFASLQHRAFRGEL